MDAPAVDTAMAAAAAAAAATGLAPNGTSTAGAVPAPMEVISLEADETVPMETQVKQDSSNGSPPSELPPLKVTFYELLIRQLQDDGFVPEAQSLSQQLRIEPNGRVERDALLEAYGKSLKWAFGDEPEGNWEPIACTPVPPLGQQEHILDFTSGTPTQSVGPAGVEAKAPPPGLTGPVVADQLGGKKAPEVRLLYTAQHKQACRALAYSADGRQVATGCADGTIRILDSARMRLCAGAEQGPLGRVRITEEELAKPIMRTLQDHVLGITCLAFHPEPNIIFWVGRQGSQDL
jgi:hypothetical protein